MEQKNYDKQIKQWVPLKVSHNTTAIINLLMPLRHKMVSINVLFSDVINYHAAKDKAQQNFSYELHNNQIAGLLETTWQFSIEYFFRTVQERCMPFH